MPRKPLARQPIKDAALELFVEQGVNATGIRDIAKRAGCSEAALYRHWKNKEDLVTSLYDEHLSVIIQLMEKHFSDDSQAVDAMQAACHELFHFYDEHPLLFQFVMLVRHELHRYADDFRQPHEVIADYLTNVHHWPTEAALHQAAAAIGLFLVNAEFIVSGILTKPLAQRADIVCKQLAALFSLEAKELAP